MQNAQPPTSGGTNSEVEFLLQSSLGDQAEVHLHRRPSPCSALPLAPWPLFSWEPSVNHMHLSLCFQGNQPKASHIFLSFHKLICHPWIISGEMPVYVFFPFPNGIVCLLVIDFERSICIAGISILSCMWLQNFSPSLQFIFSSSQ